MKHLKKFESFNDLTHYELMWSLEDISGDYSPSGSTTIEADNVLFYDINEKDDIIEQIKKNNNNASKTKLYGNLITYKGNEIMSDEEVDFEN